MTRGCAVGESELEVLDVADRLLEQMRDVIVVEVIDDASAVAVPDHEPEMTQQPQLMRYR